ncbi:MAG: hypothetical protein GY820_33110 [Gammaproteobacteria bacterium]|nr:hypothetical protein [Gammaproteobacteria bacterium]
MGTTHGQGESKMGGENQKAPTPRAGNNPFVHANDSGFNVHFGGFV